MNLEYEFEHEISDFRFKQCANGWWKACCTYKACPATATGITKHEALHCLSDAHDYKIQWHTNQLPMYQHNHNYRLRL